MVVLVVFFQAKEAWMQVVSKRYVPACLPVAVVWELELPLSRPLMAAWCRVSGSELI